MIERKTYKPSPAVSAPGWNGRNRFSGWAMPIPVSSTRIADHTFYGSKAIQRYGFYLRQLAGKTHGRYLEVGAHKKKLPRSVEQFSTDILNQGQNQQMVRR